MKKAMFAVLVLSGIFGKFVFATEASEQSDQVTQLMKKYFNVESDMTGTLKFEGRNSRGPCQLFVTDKGYGLYFVTMSEGNEPNAPDGYIGVIAIADGKTKVREFINSILTLDSTESWGNNSTRNSITIVLDEDNKILAATGENDFKEFTCFHLKPVNEAAK